MKRKHNETIHELVSLRGMLSHAVHRTGTARVVLYGVVFEIRCGRKMRLEFRAVYGDGAYLPFYSQNKNDGLKFSSMNAEQRIRCEYVMRSFLQQVLNGLDNGKENARKNRFRNQ